MGLETMNHSTFFFKKKKERKKECHVTKLSTEAGHAPTKWLHNVNTECKRRVSEEGELEENTEIKLVLCRLRASPVVC